MAFGAALSEGSGGENVNHFSTVRIRVNGIGNLQVAVYSLDDVKAKQLFPLVMAPTARIVPTRIVNFVEQRASFELKTTEAGEFMRVNRIVVYVRQIYTSYPGS